MKDRKSLPSAAVLQALLNYDQENGVLYWRARPIEMFESRKYPAERLAKSWNSRFAGEVAFTSQLLCGHCYGDLPGMGKVYAHRVIWKLMTGNDPDFIDHIDGNPRNNRWVNLRSVDHGENCRNARLPKDNTSGRIGVVRRKDFDGWTAEISRSGRRIYLGCYSTFEAACAARQAAESRLGFHPNHGRAR